MATSTNYSSEEATSSIHITSDVVEYICDPCKSRKDKDKNAVFYCNDCNDFLCKRCKKYHKRVTLTINHNVITIDEFVALNKDDIQPVSDTIRDKMDVFSIRDADKVDGRKHRTRSCSVTSYTNITLTRQFNASLEDDEKPCNVNGILVVGDIIYITDKANNKIKLFDMNDKCISKLIIARPNGMTNLNDSRIAVTHFKSSISIISKEGPTLFVDKTIQTPIPAYGISFYNGHLYVVCCFPKNPSVIPQIQVLTLDGKLKRRIEPIDQGSRVIQDPNYIAINQQTGTIYVTDWYKGVIALTSAGEVKFVQKAFSRTKTAEGVSIDEYGHVYVCGIHTHNVMQISPDGKCVIEILKEECRNAEAITIRGDNMFLGCRQTDIVRVFNLS